MYVWVSFFSITFLCTRSCSLRQSYSPGTLDLHLSITIWCWYIYIYIHAAEQSHQKLIPINILKKCHIFANFNTCVSDLEINYGGESFCSLPRLPNLEKFLSSFLKLFLFKECTSGDRGKEVHVHIGSKENENILSYINVTRDVAWYSKKPSKTFWLHTKWGIPP